MQIVIPGGTQADAARTRKVLETTGRLEVSEVARFFTVLAGEDFSDNEVMVQESDSQGRLVDGGRRVQAVRDARGRWRLADRSFYPNRGMRLFPFAAPRGQEPAVFGLLYKASLTGDDIADAQGTLNEGQRGLAITYNTLGGAKNLEFTRGVKERGPHGANLGGSGFIAFSLDGIIESAPWIRTPSGANSLIDGNFTEDELESLRTVLKAGSLAVTPTVNSQRVVGPSLGKETVDSGVEAMQDALLIIIISIILYYWWRLGIIAVAGLATCIGLVFVALSVFGATLTLPGLAGLVLTVGMAVDANILIFERIREENAPDKDKKTVIETGFGRAFLTIFDANLTTFLTALVLYIIGSGPVKGFGLTLMIGIATSMFAALYIGRFLVEFLYNKLPEVKVQQWVKPLNLPFVSMRKVAFSISGFIIIAGIAYFIFGPGGTRRNFDIDFTGRNIQGCQ